MQRNKVDFIVVGQGLAGSLVAFELEQRGKTYHIIDHSHEGAASQIAAGVVNPITGRRFVKSWMYDELIPEAQIQYERISAMLKCEIMHQRNILRVLPNQGSQTEWMTRSAWPEYAPYVLDQADEGSFADVCDPKWHYGEVTASYQVDIPILIARSQQKFLSEQKLTLEAFEFEALSLEPGITYKDWAASAIIFCEGQRARDNPLFKKELLDVSRGDILLVQIPGFKPEKLLKKKFFLIHLIDDVFWFGAKNSWDDTDKDVDPLDQQELEIALSEMINIDYEVIGHKAAVRPTVNDRRPVIGEHPEFPGVYIFNGLGTKGASLGPYWSKKLIQFILDDVPLDPEVDVRRYY